MNSLSSIASLFLLLALPCVLLGQNGQGPVSCTASATPNTVRAGGSSELTADLLLTCAGGFPTGNGAVPPFQITLNMGVDASGRVLNAPWSEALLIVDDPVQFSQLPCATDNGICVMTGAVDKTYDGSPGRFNVFQGQRDANMFVWPVVPFDSPGPNFTRTFRFTNLKVDATNLVGGSINATVSFSGPFPVEVINPTRTVANVQAPLLVGSPRPQGASGQLTGFDISVQEGFPSAFRTRSAAGTAAADQNEPGILHPGSETGFRNGNFPNITQRGNLAMAGLADTGTRLRVALNNVPASIVVNAPLTLGDNVARLVTVDAAGAGAYNPASSTTLANNNGVVAATYEIIATDPTKIEALTPSFSFAAAPGAPPATLALVNGTVQLVPRVSPNNVPQPAFSAKTDSAFQVKAPTTASLSIITTSLPDGYLQIPYSQALKASGGTSPYTFSLPAGNTLPAGLAISASGIIAGKPTGTGKFTFTARVEDANKTTATRELTINVASAPPPVSAFPKAIEFTAPAGGGPPPARAISVLAGNDTQSQFRVRVDGGAGVPAPAWLNATPPRGTTPARIVVSIDQTGLAPGDYTGRVLIVDLSGTVVLDIIDVLLKVVRQNQKLSALPAILKVETRAGQPEKRRESVLLQNAGGGGDIPVKLSIKKRSAWIIGITPAETTAPGSPSRLIGIDLDTTGLAEGFYRDVLLAEWSGATVEVPIVLWVTPNAPLLDLSDHGLRFYSRQGERNPIVKTVRVLNRYSNTTAQWRAEVLQGAEWLSISPATGQAIKDQPATIDFSLLPSVANLAAGRRYALVSVTDDGALHSPQYVVVVIEIAAPTDPPLLDFNPGGIIFTAVAGGSSVTRTLEVRTPSTDLLPYLISSVTFDSEDWLSVTPISGAIRANLATDPGTLTATASPAGLAAGVYRGQIVGFAAGVLYTVNVTFIVTPSDVSGAAIQKPAGERQASCAPKKLALVQSALVDNFAVPAGWPASLSVELRNDCGAAVTNGAVVASFSNGDPPLRLQGEGASGVYSATWTPGVAGPDMNVRLEASASGLDAATAALLGGVGPNQPPTISPNGIIHINYHPVEVGGPLAPGQPAEVYGTGLATVISPTDQLPLTTDYKGTSVRVGSKFAPLFFVSPGQVNIQIPTELTPNRRYAVLAIGGNETTQQQADIDIVPVKPGITNTRNDARELIAQHTSDFSLVTASNPAKRGEFLVMYLVGLGATNPSVASGAQAPGNPPALPVKPVTLTIGGISANVLFAGMTPGGVGLFQINFVVPETAPLNQPLEVVVTQDGVESNATRLTIAP